MCVSFTCTLMSMSQTHQSGTGQHLPLERGSGLAVCCSVLARLSHSLRGAAFFCSLSSLFSSPCGRGNSRTSGRECAWWLQYNLLTALSVVYSPLLTADLSHCAQVQGKTKASKQLKAVEEEWGREKKLLPNAEQQHKNCKKEKTKDKPRQWGGQAQEG